MTNLEIKEKIDANNKLIETILNPTAFTLNNAVKDLLKENDELQAQCTHNFVDGYCEYCYMEESK
jgi:hypothetical protein